MRIDPAARGYGPSGNVGSAGSGGVGAEIAGFLSSVGLTNDRATVLAVRALLTAGAALDKEIVTSLAKVIEALGVPEGVELAASRLIASGVIPTVDSLSRALNIERAVGGTGAGGGTIDRYLREAGLPPDQPHGDAVRAFLQTGLPIDRGAVTRLAHLFQEVPASPETVRAAARLIAQNLPLTQGALESLLLLERGESLSHSLSRLQTALANFKAATVGLDADEASGLGARLLALIDPNSNAGGIEKAMASQGRSLENRLAALLSGKEGPQSLDRDVRKLLSQLIEVAAKHEAAPGRAGSVATALREAGASLSDTILALQLQNTIPSPVNDAPWLTFHIPITAGAGEPETVELLVQRREDENPNEDVRFSFLVRRHSPLLGPVEARLDVIGHAVACTVSGDVNVLDTLRAKAPDLAGALSAVGYEVRRLRVQQRTEKLEIGFDGVDSRV